MTRTERYNELLAVYEQSKNWEKEDSDFSSYNYKVREGLTSLRRYFINDIINEFHEKYAPNLHLETYLADVHNYRKGSTGEVVKGFFLDMFSDLDFNSATVEEWFKNLSRDTTKLNTITLENLVNLAKRMGSCSYDSFKMLTGRRLKLIAGTWSGRYVTTYHLAEKIHAVECLIEMCSDPNQEPRNVATNIGIKAHMETRRLTPKEFYSTQEVNHPTIEKFKFHKNGKLVITFKTEQQAINIFNDFFQLSSPFCARLYTSRKFYPSSSTAHTDQETSSGNPPPQASN